jgi:hypothetical protein
MKSFLFRTQLLFLTVSLAAAPAPAQQVTQKAVDGVTNFKQLGTTVACAGADRFLSALTTKGNEPAFIHCASGNRAAGMWMIKRMVLDHWDAERAGAEAAALGLTSEAIKRFAIDYAKAHNR